MKIGIDLGGTNLAGGLVSDDGKLLFKTSVPTVCDKGETGRRIVEILSNDEH